MLEAVELPTGITDLDTGLTNVDADDLSHFRVFSLSPSLSRSLSLSVSSLRSRCRSSLAFFLLPPTGGSEGRNGESGKSGSVGMRFICTILQGSPVKIRIIGALNVAKQIQIFWCSYKGTTSLSVR